MQKEPESNAFLAKLQRHRGGRVLSEASQRLTEVVAGVKATGKSGSLTITITVKPAAKGNMAVMLTDKITAKIPSLEAEQSFWFATDGGELTVENPAQRQFGFSESTAKVESAPAPVPAVVNG
ncbi:MAG: hypothetical protein E6Q97_30355 [Desulfurellales bacterium]|nr:MAG: hypothetical protein E6Q97_30355 [Desulfurellales bacterium]